MAQIYCKQTDRQTNKQTKNKQTNKKPNNEVFTFFSLFSPQDLFFFVCSFIFSLPYPLSCGFFFFRRLCFLCNHVFCFLPSILTIRPHSQSVFCRPVCLTLSLSLSLSLFACLSLSLSVCNNKNRIHRRNLRFFCNLLSGPRPPTRTLKWPGRNGVQITLQHIKRLSRTTCRVTCHVIQIIY